MLYITTAKTKIKTSVTSNFQFKSLLVQKYAIPKTGISKKVNPVRTDQNFKFNILRIFNGFYFVIKFEVERVEKSVRLD